MQQEKERCCKRTPPRSILQKLGIDMLGWYLHIANNRSTDKTVFHGHLPDRCCTFSFVGMQEKCGTHHMWVSRLVQYFYAIQSNVQEPIDGKEKNNRVQQQNGATRYGYELVHGFENACDRQIVFELDGDCLVSESFEYRENKLKIGYAVVRCT